MSKEDGGLMHNERGLTLIELLATLTILSVVSVVIWNVFFQGINYSNKAVSQNTIQQESNYLTMKLTKIHQTSKGYKLNNSSCKISVEYTTQDGVMSNEEFAHPQLCLSTDFSGEVNPNSEDLPLTITINEKENTDNEFVLETVFYRLKGDQSE